MSKLYLFLFKKSLLVLIVLMTTLAWSQSTVTGRVKSAEDGSSIPGVSVIEKGGNNGTITDADGRFSITVKNESILIFSFVGFKTQEAAVNGRSSFDVSLESDFTALTEVVVVGYGEVKKSDATGAVAVVGQEKFNKGFQTSPDQLLQGRLAGVQVTSSSGAPGAASNIRIRGTASIRAGNNPLIVLDGIPLDGRDVSSGSDVGAGRGSAKNPLNFINPNDIESMSVLKDASATAIYGSRGANGVILISTKKGNKSKPQLEYSATVGFSKVPESGKYDLLSANEFRNELTNQTLDFGADVNAFDEILRTGVTNDHSLSYGGASQNGGRYRVSLALQDQQGVIKSTGLKKYTGSVNISQDVLDGRVKLQSSLISSLIRDQNAALSDNVGAEGDMFVSALRWNPTRPFRDANGVLIQPSDNERNPLAFLEYYDDNTETSKVFANVSATVNIAKGLDYKLNFGFDRSESERRIGVSRLLNANFVRGSGIGNIENIRGATNLIEHTLNFAREMSADVTLNALAGFSYQKFTRRITRQRGTDFSIDDQSLYTSNLDFAASFPSRPGPNNVNGLNGSEELPDDELQSFFGRVNLTLFQNLLLTTTMRADGSSRFGEGNKYGYFPSAAIAYKLVGQSFVPDAFSDLKVRFGWGITGNQEFPPGSSQTQYRPTPGGGITLATVGNPDLRWEQTSQINLGIDFGLFGNKLTGSVDYFRKETKDLLFRFRADQPAPDVFKWRNLDGVTIENNGVEISLDAVVVEKEGLNVDVGFNVSFLQNKLNNITSILPLGVQTGEINGQGLSSQRGQLLYDNQPLFAFYLPVFNGYDQNGASTFADLNGDGEFTGSGIDRPGVGDRDFVGDPNPNMVLGIRSSATYKKFDASIYFNGAFGHQIFDNTTLALFNRAALNGGANVDRRVLTSGQGVSDSPVPSSQFVEDGDFLRLANLTVGYTFNSEANWFQSIRVFATGQNLFVLTKYNGLDPEVNVNKSVDDVPSFGIDYAAYPRPRLLMVGFNVVF
jgi:TonB-dependent starch-binding outer membrane protein SusC